ncbi:MAG: ATP synthase F1 subunit gamma [Eubacteriaceae bacterium]
MAENIRDIKRRIKSVNNTKQITHAMELVASSKLRKARQKAEGRRAYFETMLTSIQELAAESDGVNSIFLEKSEGKKKAYIVITADRGLAGGYNSNVIRSVASSIEDKKDSSLITVGSRGRDYFKKRDYNIISEYIGITEQPSFHDAKGIGEAVTDLFKEKQVDEVYLAYTKFVSTISQKPELIKLLPLNKEDLNKEEEIENDDDIPLIMQYEPSIEGLLAYLIPKYITSTIYGAMIESSASEQGARRMAMESATENANDMIDVLTLHYNRARQAQITQELTEIIGGAEALK